MRNFLAGLSGGSGAFGAAAVCVVLIAAGYWVQSNRAAEEVVQEVALVAPETAANPSAKAAEEPSSVDEQAEPVEEAAVVPVEETEPVEEAAETSARLSPAFDEVRREADGMTVIAGRAAPGSDVKVLQNGVEIASATADGSGKFATLAMIPPDGQGHVLSLSQRFDGEEQLSDGDIILAPLAPPATPDVQTASVTSEPEAPIETAPETQDALKDEAQSADVLASAGEEHTETPTAATAETSQTDATVIVEAETPAETTPTAETTVVAETTTSEPTDTIAALEQGAQDAAEATDDVKEEVVAALDPVVADPIAPAPAKPAPVAVLRSTAEGVELLNTQNPEAMTNVAIDTISYSDVGEVELAGRAQSEAETVRVYLNNNSVVNLAVDDQGRWRGELPDVDEGIYTLRVDEVAADGKVTSRVETPFKREAPEVLAAASAAQDGPLKAITVQKGATLWAIARERYGDGELYVRVFEANAEAIRNPDLIYPGQIFDLPD